MKTVEILFVLLVSAILVACTSQPAAPISPGPTQENPAETEAPSPVPTPVPQPVAENDPQPLTDLSALVGVWRGRPVGGLLQIDGDYQTTFAQNMYDLDGTNVKPTLYRGSLSLEGSTLYFEDPRCEQGPGLYEVFLSADGVLNFVALEDDCRHRLNNLVGQRQEPRMDITWHMLTTELPAGRNPALELVHTIELPFIPHDIAVAPEGSLYAIELGAPRVHRLDGDGNVLTSWGDAGHEPGQFAFEPPPEGPQLDGGFLVVGAGGNVYVSDSYNNRVQVFSPEGEFLATWERYGPEDTAFDNLGPISADAQGNIYVADFGGAHQFDAEGKYVQTLQAAGEIAFDSQGNLYTVVLFENIAMKIPAGGGEPLIWGGEGMEDGQFTAPLWVVVGLDDTVYISDHSGRVQAFDAEGNFQALWSGPEHGDGPLAAPASLAMDVDGNLYVAPKDQTTVYVLRP